MDNLDEEIKKALSKDFTPDNYLIYETVKAAKISDNKGYKRILNIILANSLLVMALLTYLMNFTIPPVKIAVNFYCLSWLSVLVPLYLLAREKFNKGIIL